MIAIFCAIAVIAIVLSDMWVELWHSIDRLLRLARFARSGENATREMPHAGHLAHHGPQAGPKARLSPRQRAVTTVTNVVYLT